MSKIILPGTKLMVDADKSVASFIERHRRQPDAQLTRGLACASFLDWNAIYRCNQFRPNPDGALLLHKIPQPYRRGLRRRLYGLYSMARRGCVGVPYRADFVGLSEGHNIIPTEGRNSILDVYLDAATQITAWYLAIFEANYTPVAGLTAASFTADSTESTAYDEATREAITWGEPSSGSIDNAATHCEFTMNATKTIYGGGVLSASAKSSTSGTICSASKFSASRAVIDNDILRVDVTVALTSS